MILNSLNNQFVVQFPKGFFYPEIVAKWEPVVQRLKLPYQTMEDFINATVQSVTFPSVELPPVEQGQGQFKIQYRPGKELEPLLEKNLTVTFKLSEGFISYWILFEQVESFIEYRESLPFWPPMYVSFLDHKGFELVAFSFEKIIPLSLSQFEISYAQTAAEFNTFNMTLRYNRYNIKRRIDDNNYSKNNS
ncbi:MAG TPA: hypothetical protein PK122_01040 [Candidatus Paceibacterota bacterium]|nr:hypothetical protein [Candidatus Paceibacterota bacterium]